MQNVIAAIPEKRRRLQDKRFMAAIENKENYTLLRKVVRFSLRIMVFRAYLGFSTFVCLIAVGNGCAIPWIHKASGSVYSFTACQRAELKEPVRYSDAWSHNECILCDNDTRGEQSSFGEYVVLEEMLWFRDHFEGSNYSRFASGKMLLCEGSSFDCRIPVLRYWYFGILNICFTDGHDYRVTVFRPGYAVTTVYPMGRVNAEYDPKNYPWNGPRILTSACPSNGYGLHKRAYERTEYQEKVNGIITSSIPMWRLPLPTIDSMDIGVFIVQMKSLAAAIGRDQLGNVDMNTRQLVFDTIRLEYEYWRQAICDSTRETNSYYDLDDLDEFVETIDPYCRVVSKWAERDWISSTPPSLSVE